MNKSLNQEIKIYKDAYGGELRGNHAPPWQFSDVSFAEVARTMRAEGIRVQKPRELVGAPDKALSCVKLYTVDVTTEMTATAPSAYLGETS